MTLRCCRSRDLALPLLRAPVTYPCGVCHELLWAVSLPLLALPMLPPPCQGQRRRTYDAMILAGMQIGVRH
jgi:hypothetical protein